MSADTKHAPDQDSLASEEAATDVNALSYQSQQSTSGKPESQGGVLSQFRGLFTKRNPLEPPPNAFSRSPAAGLSYSRFSPMVHRAAGPHLDSGFLEILPAVPAGTTTHPFATHDISEEDWFLFLGDLQIVGKLTVTQRIAAHGAATSVAMFPATILVRRRIQKNMKLGKGRIVGELVDAWNSHYFEPRRMHVILANGDKRLSGSEGLVPDNVRDGVPVESSDSSSDEEELEEKDEITKINPNAGVATTTTTTTRVVNSTNDEHTAMPGKAGLLARVRAHNKNLQGGKYRLIIVPA